MAEANTDSKPLPLANLCLEGCGFINPRRTVDRKEIGFLAQDIKARGLTTPLVVWTEDENGKKVKTEDGKIVVISGKRRVNALMLLDEQKELNGLGDAVPCRPFKGSLMDAQLEALSDNIQRTDLSDYDTAAWVQQLLDQGAKQAAIATRINKSPGWVSRILLMYNGTAPVVHKAWQKGSITKEALVHMAENMVKEEPVVDEDGKETIRKVPDERAQEKELSRILAAKASGTKADRAKVRRKPKNKKGDKRLSTNAITSYLSDLEGHKKDKGYVHGMADALRLVTGAISADELAPPFRQHMKEVEKAKAQAAKAAAAEAGESADE